MVVKKLVFAASTMLMSSMLFAVSPTSDQIKLYNELYSTTGQAKFGTDYTPSHFGYFIKKTGTIIDIDSRDAIIGQNQNIDFQQVKESGFSLVRAYNLDVKNWQIYLDNANKNNQNVIYQVRLCQDMPTGRTYNGIPSNQCVSLISGKVSADKETFNQKLTQEIDQLNKLLSNHQSLQNFKSRVKMVLVGNEDLFSLDDFDKSVPADTTNVNDIINAMQKIRKILNQHGLSNVLISTSIQADVMLGSQKSRQTLADAIKSPAINPTGISRALAINVYPAQWAVPSNCAVTGSCMPNDLRLPNSLPDKGKGQANDHTLSAYIVKLQSKYNIPILIAETGWPTSGKGSQVQGYVYQGSYSIKGAEQYYSSLYDYVSKNKIPTLIFEMYDQAGKVPSLNGVISLNPENHYGLMDGNNKLKAKNGGYAIDLLPPTSSIKKEADNDKYHSDQLSYIVLTGYQDAGKNLFPSKFHVKLERPNFGTVVDQDYVPYIEPGTTNLIWPQLLVKTDDTIIVSNSAKSCTIQITSTPYLSGSNLSPSGHIHQDANIKVTGASYCNQIKSEIAVAGDDANIIGLQAIADNISPSVTLAFGAKGLGSIYCTEPSGKKSKLITLSSGVNILTSKEGGFKSCTYSYHNKSVSETLANGKWGGVDTSLGENWTNAEESGQVNPAIWPKQP